MPKPSLWTRLLGHWRAWRARRAVLSAPPRLAATYVQPIRWHGGTQFEKIENITYMMLEDGRGRRSYKVHDYGTCRSEKAYKKYIGPVLIWQAGGALPPLAVRNFSQQAVRLTVVK